MANWQNWGRSEQTEFGELLQPSQISEVQQMVERAVDEGARIRPIGASHSFSGIGVPVDRQLDLSRMRGLLAVDRELQQATFAAGTHLWEIPALLAPLGLAMENLGDIDRQTLAGAISTGTHGTGFAFGGIATQVRALKLVTGNAEVAILSPELTPEIWDGSAVSLGAIGIIVEVTLQCVEAFDVIATETKMPISDALERLEDFSNPQEQFEFYWFSGTREAAIKLNRRVRPGEYPDSVKRDSVRAWFDDEFLANGLFQLTTSLGTVLPTITPQVNKFAVGAMGSSFRGPSHEVFVRPRRVRFREMEYAFPLERVAEVYAELRNFLERRKLDISFPIELRVAAADNLWLSTAYGRTTGYIAVHRYWREDPTEYFTAFEKIAMAYGGRPHWGKMHYLGAEYFAHSYPKFVQFQQLRDSFDPKRIFSNTYLNRVLGD